LKRVPADAELGDGLMGEWLRVPNLRLAHHLAVMRGLEMLHIDAVGADHVPWAVKQDRKGACRRQVVLALTVEERRRVRRFGPVEEENCAVPFHRGKRQLLGKGGNVGRRRNAPAAPFGVEFPMMERAP